MGYSNGFALAVRVGGQFVHELANGELHVPFGAVYSLRFKNKHNRCAKVDVRIDGEGVGAWEVPAFGSIDIQRPANRDSAFMFASLDSDAAYAAGKGGSNPNNQKGLIEATFYLEHQVFMVTTPWVTAIPKSPSIPYHVSYTSRSIGTSANDVLCSSIGETSALADGCTVDGGSTGQQFGTSYRQFEAEGTTVKVFLRGYAPPAAAACVPASPLPRDPLTVENNRLKQAVAAKRAEKERAERELALAIENEALRQELATLA